MLPTVLPRPTAAALTCVTALSALSASSGDAPGSGTAVRDGASVVGTAVRRDSALHGLLPDAARESGTVRVATDLPSPPFGMSASPDSDETAGPNCGLGQAPGAKPGARSAFSAQKFDGIVPALRAGRFGVAIPAITDDKDRQRVVGFADHVRSGSAVMAAEGNSTRIGTPEDLCGRKVNVRAAANRLKLLTAHQATRADAHSPGMRPMLTMRRIVLPQAMREDDPPMGHETINMLKATGSRPATVRRATGSTGCASAGSPSAAGTSARCSSASAPSPT